jgi:predicted kinase
LKAILIIGLPGSGKTYLAKNSYSEYKLIDDPSVNNIELEEVLSELEDVVICDPNLCDVTYRNRIKELLNLFGYAIKEIYFENEPIKAYNNIKCRQYARDKYLESASSFNYHIPSNIISIPIYELTSLV